MRIFILLLLPAFLWSQDLMEEKMTNGLRITELNSTINYYQNFIDQYEDEIVRLEKRNQVIDSLLALEVQPPDQGKITITVESCTSEFPILQSVTYLVKKKAGDATADIWKERPAVFGIWSPSRGVIQSHCVGISQNEYDYNIRSYGDGWYWGKAKGYDPTKPHPRELPPTDLITAAKDPISFDIPWPDFASDPGQVSTTWFTYVEESGELYVHFKSEEHTMINALKARKRKHWGYASSKSSAEYYLQGLERRGLDDRIVRTYWGL